MREGKEREREREREREVEVGCTQVLRAIQPAYIATSLEQCGFMSEVIFG